MTVPEPSVPAVVRAVRTVDPDRAEAFGMILAGMLRESGTQAGWLGADIIRPPADATGPGEWQILFRFRSEADLTRWSGSDTAIVWRARLDALTVGEARVERIDGMELWLSAPGTAPSSPPRWKMAILTGAIIYPFILTMPAMLSPLVGNAPQWLASLANVVVMIPLMTWLIMPRITKLLRNWLYADVSPAAQASLFVDTDTQTDEPPNVA